MIGAWGLLVRKSLLDSGRSPLWALLGECGASFTALAVYWFTSRAMGPTLSFSGDYFTFIVVGEAALILPLTLWAGVGAGIRSGTNDGTLEVFLTLPLPAPALISLQAAAGVPREAARLAVTWGVAAAVFGFSVPAWRLGEILALQLCAVPLFLGLGLAAGAALVRLGRGHAALAQVSTLASILSGAYFPLSVLPEPLRAWSRLISPFTWVVDTARQVVSSGWSTATSTTGLAWIALGVLVMALGWGLLELSFASLRRRGQPLLFPV